MSKCRREIGVRHVDNTGFTPMTLEIHVPFRCPMTLVLPLLILKFTKKVPNSCHKLVSGSVENTDHLDTETLSSGKLVSKLVSGYGENTDHLTLKFCGVKLVSTFGVRDSGKH